MLWFKCLIIIPLVLLGKNILQILHRFKNVADKIIIRKVCISYLKKLRNFRTFGKKFHCKNKSCNVFWDNFYTRYISLSPSLSRFCSCAICLAAFKQSRLFHIPVLIPLLLPFFYKNKIPRGKRESSSSGA